MSENKLITIILSIATAVTLTFEITSRTVFVDSCEKQGYYDTGTVRVMCSVVE